jgi:predicted O-methyltransferase YrrM
VLSIVSQQEAQNIIGFPFRQFGWQDFSLKWTDFEDTSHIVNLLGNSKEILEIGTYLGHTTENIASNTKSFVVTVDICKGMVDSLAYQNNEILEAEQSGSHIKSESVTRMLMKSDEFFENAKASSIKFDGILIDGDHSYEQVKRDSLNAIECSKKGTIIVWHDVYNRDTVMCPKTLCQPTPPNYDVCRVLDELEIPVYKIERSWVGFSVI